MASADAVEIIGLILRAHWRCLIDRRTHHIGTTFDIVDIDNGLLYMLFAIPEITA
jgi:hypothetical protein